MDLTASPHPPQELDPPVPSLGELHNHQLVLRVAPRGTAWGGWEVHWGPGPGTSWQCEPSSPSPGALPAPSFYTLHLTLLSVWLPVSCGLRSTGKWPRSLSPCTGQWLSIPRRCCWNCEDTTMSHPPTTWNSCLDIRSMKKNRRRGGPGNLVSSRVIGEISRSWSPGCWCGMGEMQRALILFRKLIKERWGF